MAQRPSRGAVGGLDPDPRGDVLTSSADNKCGTRDRRTSLLSVLDLFFLHVDQGGDEKSDDAFPLVVPTGFEPVSPP